MDNDDFRDLEDYVLRSGAAPSLGLLRPYFPRWRRQLLANGVVRASRDTLASDLMIGFIWDAMPTSAQNRSAMHDHRNLLCRLGAPMLRQRGWKP